MVENIRMFDKFLVEHSDSVGIMFSFISLNHQMTNKQTINSFLATFFYWRIVSSISRFQIITWWVIANEFFAIFCSNLLIHFFFWIHFFFAIRFKRIQFNYNRFLSTRECNLFFDWIGFWQHLKTINYLVHLHLHLNSENGGFFDIKHAFTDLEVLFM